MLLLKNSPFKGLVWCGREDSNFHGCYPTATSTLRVYHSATTALSGLVGRRIDEPRGDVKSKTTRFCSFCTDP